MRVISGKSKGHKLKSPKGLKTRPTIDRIKESLFNILGNIDNEDIILDLFSGSGGIGIEFLSRGAKRAYFVDTSSESINIIKDNLKHTNLYETGVVIKDDALSAVEYFSKSSVKFNYIFLDPPFKEHDLLISTIEAIDFSKLLIDNGTIIIEHETDLQLQESLFNFQKVKFRKYGNETISFYKYYNKE